MTGQLGLVFLQAKSCFALQKTFSSTAKEISDNQYIDNSTAPTNFLQI